MTHPSPQARTGAHARAESPASPSHDCGLPSSDDSEHLRCLCGSLLARYVPGGIELKCRRCKRTLTVPLEKLAEPADAT